MRIERNPTSPLRGYELRSKKNAGSEGTSQSFGAEITQQNTSAQSSAGTTATAVVPNASASISGEEYLKLYQESAAANSPEAKSAAEHKALRAASDSTGVESTASETKVAKPMEELPVILPTDSVEVKLEKLRQISEASDYTGMSYEEIYTDLWNRYNDAFDGRLSAICSSVTASPPHWHKISNQFSNETELYVFRPLREDFKVQGLRKGDAGYDEYVTQRYSDIRSAPLGYSGMTYEEKEAAILAKYQGKDSFLDFLSMQGELQHTMIYRNKMGFYGEIAYLNRMNSEIRNSYLGGRFEQENILTQVQKNVRYISHINLLSEAQWDILLQGNFDVRSFFAGMKASLEDVVFKNYDYDVRGMIDHQINGFMELLDKHWQE